MASSLRKFGRKASQLFSRDDESSSQSSRRFQIVRSINEEESSECGMETTTQLRQQALPPTAANSILRYVNSNFTQGSSLADMDSIRSREQADYLQARREEDNIAMRRIDSTLSPMEPNSLAASTRRRVELSRPGRRGNAFFRGNQLLDRPGTKVYRHQPKPSVPEEVNAGFFARADSRPKFEGTSNRRVNPKLSHMSSMPSIPSSTDSFRDRKLRGTLVRKSSMNWEVDDPQSGEAPIEFPPTHVQGHQQPSVESARPSDRRAWADFTDSEFDGDSRRQLVQVGPEEWRLASTSIQNLASHAIPEYQPVHPSEVIPEEFIPQGHILAGSLSQRNFNANPATNPVWGVQHSYPCIQNLTAAVHHASTDMHALILENQVLKHEAAVNAYKIQGLEQELLRVTELVRDADLNTEQYQEFSIERARQHLEARMADEGNDLNPTTPKVPSETSELYGSATTTEEHGTTSNQVSEFDVVDEPSAYEKLAEPV